MITNSHKIQQTDIIIAGAGLTGLALSIYLAKRGYQVCILDKREYPKHDSHPHDRFRSLSLDLSFRGLQSLNKIGLKEAALQLSVPMRKRVFHLPSKDLVSLDYSNDCHNYINTISRFDMHQLLLKKAMSYKTVQVLFEHEISSIKFEHDINRITVNNTNTEEKSIFMAPQLFGCDGANSLVRHYIESKTGVHFTRQKFDYEYKELTIPASKANNLVLEAMHMWTRENAMLVAQPNIDGSFTCALLLPTAGDTSFRDLGQPEKNKALIKYFNDSFTDVAPLISNLENSLINRPIGTLSTVNGGQWSINQQALLLGDSAHAMLPFFGQGMNSCFEDCYLLDQLLDNYQDNWHQVIPLFEATRKQDTTAIATMSLENYPELRGKHWACSLYERQIEDRLMKGDNHYKSYHNLVCFTDMRYHKIAALRIKQLLLINELSNKIESLDEIDMLNLKDTSSYHSITQIDNGREKP